MSDIKRTFTDCGTVYEEDSEYWEEVALQSDPFDGDFGDQGDSTLSDKIVVARKSNTPCSFCLSPTISGTKIRVRTDSISGEIQHYRWCHECCHAFVLSELCCDADGRDIDDDLYDDEKDPIALREQVRNRNDSEKKI